jgi:membrane fusion protein, heavy metal efflux system
MRSRHGWFSTTLFAAAALLAACGRAPEETPAAPAANAGEVYTAQDPRGIRVVAAEKKSVPDMLQVPARVEADPTRVLRVFPPVSGRLIAVNVRPSDRVAKGQMIAELDSGDVAAGRGAYDSAKANADLKRKALDRATMLYQKGVIAQKDFEQAQADDAAAQAALSQARDQLRILGSDPASPGFSSVVRVLAPRAGVVLDVNAAPGQFSKSLDASDPLCTIADIDSVWIVGDVLENDVGAVRPGAAADISINAYPGKTWKSTISAVSDAVDPLTHTLKARAVLPNPGLELKPEMYGSLSVVRSTEPALVVPVAAVLREGAAAYVFIQKGENRFERRDVEAGRTFGGEIEIKSGLQPGESVVSEGALLLRAAS